MSKPAHSANKSVAVGIVCALALLLLAPAVFSEMKPDLQDEYLDSQFEWAAYVNAQIVNHYLDYDGTSMHPLTRVRVYFKRYQRPAPLRTDDPTASLYEELWYFQGKPIGLRRHTKMDAAKMVADGAHDGAVVLGQYEPQFTQAVTNALLRLVVDQQLSNLTTNVVLVPRDRFNEVCGQLEQYHFSNEVQANEGAQFSIHLRSYPEGRDEYYLLRK